MKLLNLTKHRRLCLQQMLDELFYEFDKVKLKRNGFIIFQKNHFKFWDRKKIHASELILKEIPTRIESFARKFTVMNYTHYDPKIQEHVIEIINENKYIDIIEYLWSEFTKVKFKVNTIKPSNAIILSESNLNNAFKKHCSSIVLSPASQIGNIISHIKKSYSNSERIKVNLNLRKVFDKRYFPIKQLKAA